MQNKITMKKLTTITAILLIILTLGCNAQEPQTIIKHLDSLNVVITEKDSIILDREVKISTLQLSLDTYNDSEITVIADTLNFEVSGDGIKVEVTKEGHNVWIDLTNQDTIISVTYLDYIRNVILSE